MTTKTLALLVTTFITLGSVANAANTPKYYRGDLIHTTQKFVRVGGDAVIFGYKIAPGCDEESLKNTAISLKNRTSTDRWDDQWYAFNVARGRCLMIGWYNLTGRTFGWAAIQNQPTSWSVRSNTRGWGNLGNGTQAKYSFKINGQAVDLDIFNPNNTGALDGNDILISFGY
jgi:hypothetical protein